MIRVIRYFHVYLQPSDNLKPRIGVRRPGLGGLGSEVPCALAPYLLIAPEGFQQECTPKTVFESL